MYWHKTTKKRYRKKVFLHHSKAEFYYHRLSGVICSYLQENTAQLENFLWRFVPNLFSAAVGVLWFYVRTSVRPIIRRICDVIKRVTYSKTNYNSCIEVTELQKRERESKKWHLWIDLLRIYGVWREKTKVTVSVVAFTVEIKGNSNRPFIWIVRACYSCSSCSILI